MFANKVRKEIQIYAGEIQTYIANDCLKLYKQLSTIYVCKQCDRDYNLIFASQTGAIKIIKYLLKTYHFTKNVLTKSLVKACDEGYLNILKKLINYGADINVCTAYQNLLTRASVKGYIKIVKYLVEEQKFDIHYNDDNCLRVASKEGKFEIVKYLVSCGADIHARNEESLIDSSACGYFNVSIFLIENGANIAFNNYEPLRMANTYNPNEY